MKNRTRPLIGNRVTEKDIRDHLSSVGFSGDAATFQEVELHAISRPGWLQLFRFERDIRDQDGARTHLFGAVLDDERNHSDFWWSLEKTDQLEKLDEWSTGLIPRGRTHRTPVHWLLLSVFGVFVLLAAIGWILRQFGL